MQQHLCQEGRGPWSCRRRDTGRLSREAGSTHGNVHGHTENATATVQGERSLRITSRHWYCSCHDLQIGNLAVDRT